MTRCPSPSLKWHNWLAVWFLLVTLGYGTVFLAADEAARWLRQNQPGAAQPVRLWRTAPPVNWVDELTEAAVRKGTYRPARMNNSKVEGL